MHYAIFRLSLAFSFCMHRTQYPKNGTRKDNPTMSEYFIFALNIYSIHCDGNVHCEKIPAGVVVVVAVFHISHYSCPPLLPRTSSSAKLMAISIIMLLHYFVCYFSLTPPSLPHFAVCIIPSSFSLYSIFAGSFFCFYNACALHLTQYTYFI